jgi:predicted enzyme related to lactoylglutathione lyase
MAIKIGSIVIHCFEFYRMIDFWKNALNYNLRETPTDDWAVLTDSQGKGPNLSFQKRETKRQKKNWIHLDLYTSNLTNEVERLLEIGAKKYSWRYPENTDYIVLEDPDGNLFCVVQKNE